MGSKDLGEAAKKSAERKKLLRTPVPMRPDAPENIKLSKEAFIAKRRAEKEEDVKVEEYRAKLRAEKEEKKEDSSDGLRKEEVEKEEVVPVVKKGRPKKVE